MHSNSVQHFRYSSEFEGKLYTVLTTMTCFSVKQVIVVQQMEIFPGMKRSGEKFCRSGFNNIRDLLHCPEIGIYFKN